jgi:hypothetical protein
MLPCKYDAVFVPCILLQLLQDRNHKASHQQKAGAVAVCFKQAVLLQLMDTCWPTCLPFCN